MQKPRIRKSKNKSLLVTNEEYEPVLTKLLENAKKSVDIIAFSFGIGSVSGTLSTTSAPYRIAEKLAELKKRFGSKITIRLYIEGHRETADRNRVAGEYLKKRGVQVRYGSTHAKGFCIDGRYVLFGSTNLTNQSIAKNNEANLVCDDPSIVHGFERYFTHLWEGGKHGEIGLPPPLIADGGFKDVLVRMIDQAKSRLEFSIYFFHMTEIENAFIRAHERGVKVRGFVHHHESFALSYVKRTRATIERLQAAGIDDLHFGPGHLFTHSKYLIQDRKILLLGTGNWLHEDIKVHPQLYIQLQDSTICRDLAKRLADQISRRSAAIESRGKTLAKGKKGSVIKT